MEGWRGSKLSRRSTTEERESAKSWGTIGEEGPLNRFPQKPTVGGQICAGAVLPPHAFQPTNGWQTSPHWWYCHQRRRYYRGRATEGSFGGTSGGTTGGTVSSRRPREPQQRYCRQRRRYCHWCATEGMNGGTSGGTTAVVQRREIKGKHRRWRYYRR